MAITQEMFRFVSTRRPERFIMSRIASRLIRDRRETTPASMLIKLFGPGLYEDKLVIANAFAAGNDFVEANDPAILLLEPVIDFFRDKLEPEIILADLETEFQAEFPKLTGLLQQIPPKQLLESTIAMTARLWDSLYAQTIRGCNRYVSTNYLADGLRVYHIFRLLWMSRKLKLETWAGRGFDDYDTLIDVNSAMALEEPNDGNNQPKPQPIPHQFESLQVLTESLTHIDDASDQVNSLLMANAVKIVTVDQVEQTFFNAEAINFLSSQPAFNKLDLQSIPVEQIQLKLIQDRQMAVLKREQALSALVDPGASHAVQVITRDALARKKKPKVQQSSSLNGLASQGGVFRVPLEVGALKPPTVGDLLLVEQELRRYEMGELAEIETIMQGERRERTIRKLARTSQTTTTETLQEQEQSSSLKTDERFQLSSQAQKTASENFGVEMGVSVSGKFGPVQVSASVNASYDTSKSSSESTSQEYAKTVTEEASKRVKNSYKESSSITILTETQDTSLRGFNNEKGMSHVNGLYRWIDKIYDAKLVNYGRRLMFSLNVPEPAAFYRALILQDESETLADLVEPLHPSRIRRDSVKPLPESKTAGGFLRYQDLTEDNYAKLAALYDVAVQPPPPAYLTGSKAYVYPQAMEAVEVSPHDAVNELSYVTSDNSLTLDPGYRLTQVAVHAPVGNSGEFGSYVDALKLGEVVQPSQPKDGSKISEADLILVQVANMSFFMTVRRDPDDSDKKIVVGNFNEFQPIDETWQAFGDLVQPAIPVTITAKFEGVLNLTVTYIAKRTDEALDQWKSSTFAAIIKGYTSKKQAYDQAIAVAQSKAQSATEEKTFNLRDDQYRSIELTELKRGCIDLLSAGTATGYTSIAVSAEDGTPEIIYDPAEGTLLNNWRSPLANGSVAEFFELAFAWEETTYQFLPYYWAGSERWKELAQATGADPVFEQFLRAGNASVVVPVRPGFERPVIFFLKTGLIWGGGYMSLFTSQDMLDVYADVELGQQFDPPLQIGDPWEIRLPTSMVMLQEDGTLPVFPPEERVETMPLTEEPVPDDSVPF